ncbi:hypothetical protein MTO96_039654 [Rhipicephalus appendiculatus]
MFYLRDLGPIIGALFFNSTLSELNFIGFRIYIPNIEIITDVLSRNRGLRSFHISNCSFHKYDIRVNTVPVFPSGSSLIPLWSAALAKNNTLEELTMDLSWMEPEYCSSFFWALAANKSLKKVYVPKFRHSDVVQICGAIRNTGVPERFIVGEHHVLRHTAAALPECKALSRIGLYRCTRDEVEPLHTILCLLPTCSHVNSLCLEISWPTFNAEVSSLLAQYLTKTATLRELRLKFFFSGPPGRCDMMLLHFPGTPGQYKRTLLQALSNNKSVRRLSLEGIGVGEDEAQMLADMLQSSRTLCYLSYRCDFRCETTLLGKLSPNISDNYMLLGMQSAWHWRFGTVWYSVKDAIRRNNSLVTRAAHFVMGTRCKYCAAAAELVHFSPGVVEKVQELASVDEEGAVSRIKRSMKSLTELHEFMCLVGVVKRTVNCHRRKDGHKQFVDLNRDCWLHVRQFLKVSDILDPE